MRVRVEATVYGICDLDDEQEQDILNYIEENGLDPNDADDINTAINAMYDNGDLDIYREYTESEWNTESIDYVDDDY